MTRDDQDARGSGAVVRHVMRVVGARWEGDHVAFTKLDLASGVPRSNPAREDDDDLVERRVEVGRRGSATWRNYVVVHEEGSDAEGLGQHRRQAEGLARLRRAELPMLELRQVCDTEGFRGWVAGLVLLAHPRTIPAQRIRPYLTLALAQKAGLLKGRPALEAYTERLTSREAFKKAYAS